MFKITRDINIEVVFPVAVLEIVQCASILAVTDQLKRNIYVRRISSLPR